MPGTTTSPCSTPCKLTQQSTLATPAGRSSTSTATSSASTPPSLPRTGWPAHRPEPAVRQHRYWIRHPIRMRPAGVERADQHRQGHPRRHRRPGQRVEQRSVDDATLERRSAAVPGTPAAKAGLRAGDVRSPRSFDSASKMPTVSDRRRSLARSQRRGRSTYTRAGRPSTGRGDACLVHQ